MPAFRQHPETPFPVGVEYYRAPIPRPRVWDGDFARIRRAGLRIVRSFSYGHHPDLLFAWPPTAPVPNG